MKKTALALLMILLCLTVLACNQTTTSTALTTTTTTTEPGTTGTTTTGDTQTTTTVRTYSETDSVVNYEGSYCDDLAVDAVFIESLLDSLTLAEKAGQMLQAEKNGASAADVRTYNLGSVLSGGGSSPSTNTATEWYYMYASFQNAARLSSSGIPIMYGIDAVHGDNNVYGATIFPHNIGLGAANDPELMGRIGTVVAREIRVTGMNYTFSPAVSVVQNPAWGRTYESLGESADLVSGLTGAYVEGLQNYCVSASAKHFLADGGTDGGHDQGNATLTEEELRLIHLPGYEAAIAAGVDTIMVSYSSINGTKMHENGYWITDVLKGELGFEGFVISDYNAIHQIGGDYYDQIVASVNAGIDMLMEPFDWKSCIENIIAAVNAGDISETRIDDAVRRILTVKYKMGLFADEFYNESTQVYYRLSKLSAFATEENQSVAREAVRESLVLLKNENNALPLDKNATIAVLGEGASNMGLQCGGWTISWQGDDDPDLTPGTTILEGLTSVASASGGTIYADPDDADIVVIVLSEIPYAEYNGDNANPTLTGATAHAGNYALLEQATIAHGSGKTVIGLLLSGRPMLLGSYLAFFDAFVACWLPGTEGGNGIADVLYGDFDFTGKLPVTWPKNVTGLGMNINSVNYNPEVVLFPFGFGLDYKGE